MNLLMLTDYFPPHLGGGIERAAYELASRLARQDHQVTVITTNSDQAPGHQFMEDLEVLRVPALDLTRTTGMQLTISPHAWAAISRVISDRRIDAVHVHGLFFHLSLAGVVVARARGLPVVTTAHVGSLATLGGTYGRLATLYERTFGRLIVGWSSHVIAVSEAVAAHVLSLGSAPEKTTVIPNGVDTDEFSPSSQEPPGPPRVLIVGRLIFNKGPQYLVEAIPLVLERHPETEFWFVGDGPLRKELESRVRQSGIGRRVTFFGERAGVAALLRQGHLLVRPSLLEGLPLTVLEAMACGLPVVATSIGGSAELVRDGVNGYLVEPGNVGQLAARICDLLDDPGLRRKMGAEGRALVEDAFNWDENARQTAVVYRKVLAPRTLARQPLHGPPVLGTEHEGHSPGGNS